MRPALIKRAGLAITSHVGRRYCVTRLASVNVFAAMQQAGHANLETTRAYVRESREELRRVVGLCDPLSR
jgi:integrase